MPVTFTVPALVTGEVTTGTVVGILASDCPVIFTESVTGVVTVEDNKPPVPATLVRLSKASVIAVGTKPAESNS